MIKLNKSSNCCGCTACASICSHKAIIMQPDAMGFLYPVVDEAKCINCGLCEQVCAFNEHYDISRNLPQPKSYAVRHKDMNEVMSSRSGAAFIALSDWILNQGGVVYGVGYDKNLHIIHKRAISKSERDEFKGSKYVQSDMRGIMQQVKADLKSGHKVLFSGTPCQTAAVAIFVSAKLRDNLFLLDIICHGVPSPKFWADYIEWQEHKMGAKIVAVDFRDKKRFGWDDHIETLYTSSKRKSVNTFTHFFYLEYISRNSCYECKYCNLKRPSDVTIGDFWGLDKIDPKLNKDNKGYSLVLANTSKGQEWLQEVSNEVYLTPVSLEKSLQPNLKHPTPKKAGANQFVSDYLDKGFIYVLEKYGNTDFKSLFKEKMENIKKNRIL